MTADPAHRDDTRSGEAASVPASPRRWLRVLPVLVLLVAIAGQITLMSTVNIDRQTGSGFGMFSSVDFAGSRSVVVTATFDAQQVQVQLPASANDQVDELLYAPTDSKANELALDLASQMWTEEDGLVLLGDQGIIANITVVVRGLTADGHTLGSHVLAEGDAG